ncbi:N-acetylmuramoyl-L-alanine amidase [Streptomyces sp. NPDC092296]|uniref:N-acetylmuramoyl-L-alanine amidase n=1 Tax=Streptomyces sp. NPDC092296 TaxID=3366012 RepID=UPI003803CC58
MPLTPETPDSSDTPEPDDDALFGAPYGELRPRRSPTARLLIALAVLAPTCFAGWLGWQAVAGGAPATPAAAATTQAAPVTRADPATPATPPTEAPPTPQSAPTPHPTTAAPTAAGRAPADRPLKGRTVVLDPGHNPGNGAHTAQINRTVDIGGSRKECDTTGTETDAGYPEASFTLDVARRARKILQAEGAKVVFTQDGDRPWGPCVDERAEIGNRAHADAAVSVHGDGGPAAGHGFHVILPARVVSGKADTASITDPSRRLGLQLRNSFAAATGEPLSSYLGQDGIDVRGDLGGLNLSRVPKVFIECGNMRNATDARHMTDPRWRQRAAQGIADGLTAFLTGKGR